MSDAVRDAFRTQARACRDLGSPFTARLCDLAAARLDRTTPVGRAVLDWPGEPSSRGDSVPLRLAGALHGLARAGAEVASVYPPHDAACDDATLWAEVGDALRDHAATILEWLRSPPQTNEVRRSAVLVPGFLTVAALTGLPLALSELGASAGINLLGDRYRLNLDGHAFGPADAAVTLCPEWRGPPPPGADLRVVDRAGCDLAPRDPASPRDCARLLAYVWADQLDRLSRTEAALKAVAAEGVTVARADAADWLSARLAVVRPGAAHVVFHSIAWQYFTEATKTAAKASIEAAGARATRDAPLAWLRFEADGATPGADVRLTLWPGGREAALGRGDFHGRWVAWKGWPTRGALA